MKKKLTHLAYRNTSIPVIVTLLLTALEDLKLRDGVGSEFFDEYLYNSAERYDLDKILPLTKNSGFRAENLFQISELADKMLYIAVNIKFTDGDKKLEEFKDDLRKISRKHGIKINL